MGIQQALLGAGAEEPYAGDSQQAYTTPGTYTWTAPAQVTSVSVVCVGGGGGGERDSSGGNMTDGGDSYFINTSTVCGYGGKKGGGFTNQGVGATPLNGRGAGGGYVGGI